MIGSVPRRALLGCSAVLVLAGCSATVSGNADQQDLSNSMNATAQILAGLGDDLKADPPTDVNPPADDGSLPPVVRSVNTSDHVVFLTIDDGATADPRITDILRKTGIPVTPFLTENVTSTKHEFFKEIGDITGQTIQNHSITHPHMTGLNQLSQRNQICQTSNDYQNWYGTRPWLFRPPYGEFNDSTRTVAKSCGINYLVNWDVSLPAAHLRYSVGDKLRPGDVILTHWRPDLYKDLPRALKDIDQQGFQIAALQDYLPQH